MTANEHLNEELFGRWDRGVPMGTWYHGTPVPLSPKTKKIRAFTGYASSAERGNKKLAFATTDYELAKSYGRHVYEVSPNSETIRSSDTHIDYKPDLVSSEENVAVSPRGFDIVRKLSNEELTHRNVIMNALQLQRQGKRDYEQGRTWTPTSASSISELSRKLLGPTSSPYGARDMHLHDLPKGEDA